MLSYAGYNSVAAFVIFEHSTTSVSVFGKNFEHRFALGIADFKSDKARKMFTDWQARSKRFASDVEVLERERDAYASAGKAEKQRMTQGILALERTLETEQVELERMEMEIRRLEQQELYK